METQFTYELKDKLSYSRGGDIIDATTITVTAPTGAEMRWAIPLRQWLSQAIAESQRLNPLTDAERADAVEIAKARNDDVPDDDPAANAGEILGVMSVCTTVSLEAVFTTTGAMLSAGLAKVDGEVALTSTLWKKMSMRDIHGIVGEFLAVFTIAS